MAKKVWYVVKVKLRIEKTSHTFVCVVTFHSNHIAEFCSCALQHGLGVIAAVLCMMFVTSHFKEFFSLVQ